MTEPTEYWRNFHGPHDVTPRLHIVAGISGTGIQRALLKLESYTGEHGNRVFGGFVSLDHKLRALAVPAVRKIYPFKYPGLLAVFLLPRQYLRSLWLEALDSAFAEVDQHFSEGRSAILTMHLCYFHHAYREFLVPADFDRIRERLNGRASSVVTLVDDTYDCLARLSQPTQIFRRPTSHERAFQDALTVLRWRANELLVADGLAATCGIPHYVFATKHPIATFHDLLYTDKLRVYVSHPISEVRRLRAQGRERESQELLTELQRFVTQLEAEYVVFEPTAIDEARFRTVKRARDAQAPPPRGEEFLGNLDARWPFVTDSRNLLWEPPPALDGPFAFPAGWQEDTRDEIPDSPVVEEVRETILRQIGARDHWLVEQADLLACYRPLFEGHASKGVQEELRHLARLRRLDVPTSMRHAAVVCPLSDRELFPRRTAWQLLIPEKAGTGQIVGHPQDVSRLTDTIRIGTDPGVSEVLKGDVEALERLLGKHRLSLKPSEDDSLASGGALQSSDRVREHRSAEQLADLIVGGGVPYLDELRDLGVLTEHPDADSALDALRRDSHP